jgi:hypothetical protein
MLHSGEAILADIDATLDQLIDNAEAMRTVSRETLSEFEIESLQKTQESLLARLLHMDTLLDSEKRVVSLRKKSCSEGVLQQKIAEFGRLNERLIQDVAIKFGPKEKPVKKMRLPRNRRGKETALKAS